MITIYDFLLEQELDMKKLKIMNTEESLRTFFPYLFNSIKGNIQFFFPNFTGESPRLSKIWKEHVTGIDIITGDVASPIPNAFTIPGIPSKGKSVILSIPIIRLYILNYMMTQSTRKITGTPGKNGQVIIKSNTPNVRLVSWSTKGLNGMLDDRELLSVHLHELGHWANVDPVINSAISRIVSNIFLTVPVISIPLYIYSIYNGRLGEWAADGFAKNCGYGQELSNALVKLGYRQRSNISILGKIDDIFNRIFIKIHNIVDTILPITIHPSVKKRVTKLRECNFNSMDENDIRILNEVILEGMVSDKATSILRATFEPLDKIFAKNVNVLTPYGK